MRIELQEIEAILTDPAPPTVTNTLDAMERAGALLSRVTAVFFNQLGADASRELEDVEETVAPELAAHHDAIYMDPRLAARLRAVRAEADAGRVLLEPDQEWLLDSLQIGRAHV